MIRHSLETPSFYSDPTQWAEAVTLQYMTRGLGAEQPETFYVLDVDDTILDSNLRWYEDYVAVAGRRGIDSAQVVGQGEFKELTPRACFIRMGFTHDDYNAYKTERMHSVDFHQNMQVLGGACTALADFRHVGYLPGAYLSTRPEVLGDVTKQNLEAEDFAPAPLLVRPARYGYENTIPFKIEALESLRNTFDTVFLEALPIAYVDDYGAVAEGIKNLGRPGLNAVLFEGDHTWAALLNK